MFYGPFDYPGRRPDGPWHEDETAVLLRAWRRGDSLEELSERHHRPIEAILSRLRDRGALGVGAVNRARLGFAAPLLEIGTLSRG
jgi:hypothetical protein